MRSSPRVLIASVVIVSPRTATLGDAMSIFNVSRRLARVGVSSDVLWPGAFPMPGISALPLERARPEDYDALCYVCGPLRPGFLRHPLFLAFRGRPRFACGVSLIGALEEDVAVHARDTSFDLALAQEGWRHPERRRPQDRGSVQLCLVHDQPEYGRRSAGRARAVEFLTRAAHRLAAERVESIDTLITDWADDPFGIERDFADAELVLTTRLHGSLLSLYHGVPFVALDQIEGGGKVGTGLRGLGWPFVLSIENADLEAVRKAAEAARDPSFRPRLDALRSTALRLADEALAGCSRMILDGLGR